MKEDMNVQYRTMVAIAAAATLLTAASAETASEQPVLKGKDAFGSWQDDKPGTMRLIRPEDLPPPGATRSASNGSRIVRRPKEAVPQVPPRFKIELFAQGLSGPRTIRIAPNGDIFVVESEVGRIRIFRATDGAAKPSEERTYVDNLNYPFGIAFYPPGNDPKWLYVANTDGVVRFPYHSGDLSASGPAQTIVPNLPEGGHATRDIAFTKDGSRMLVSVGSGSNVGEGVGRPPGGFESWSRQHALGATWGYETDRASVLSFDPEGKHKTVFATGIRNCVALVVQPQSGEPWCATNERDGLGDDLVPDYVTRVREGAFYGWPWFYLGAHEDPRQAGQRPDLKDKITVPDVLLQSHSAPLGLAFYEGGNFPVEYRGDGFVAAHGSWNRAKRTGYKVVRIRMKDGVPTGEYQDFVTGFVLDDRDVWGRPVGVAVARDGALLVSEDANGTIWRVTHE
jgi:glucose/arabinose dehydrogenase